MSTTTVEALRFLVRPDRRDTDAGRWRIWRTRCGRYRVAECRSHYGLPLTIYAERVQRRGDGWTHFEVISKHRSRRVAMAVCQRDAKERMRAEG